jgi:RNA-binding protein
MRKDENGRPGRKNKGELFMLTSKQRAALRSAANTLDPVYQIGKGEIDESVKQGVADCLAARELIKLKVLENSSYTAREASELLCAATGAECVQVIGRKFVLFLKKKKESAFAALLKQ